MFNFKNPQPETPGPKVNLDHKKDFSVEDIPIYTMKKDLENPFAPAEENVSAKSTPAGENELSEKQKTSPFLTQETAISPSPFHSKPPTDTAVSTPSANKFPSPAPIIIKREDNLSDIKEVEDTNWSRIVLIAVAIFILLISGAGGYYFWITRQEEPITYEEISDLETEPILEETEESEETSETEEPVVEVPEPLRPDYFPLEIAGLDAGKFKTAIDEYFSEATNPPITGTLKEFVLVDPQNNPIKFKDFAASAKITFPADLLSNLNDTFSLFIYIEDKTPKIGLAIDSKNDPEVKRLMLEQENSLDQELNSIFLLSTYTAKNVFASSNYEGSEIRYQNLISPEKLSIDYTVYKNKLLIGTTKLTLRYMLDFLSAKSAEVQ